MLGATCRSVKRILFQTACATGRVRDARALAGKPLTRVSQLLAESVRDAFARNRVQHARTRKNRRLEGESGGLIDRTGGAGAANRSAFRVSNVFDLYALAARVALTLPQHAPRDSSTATGRTGSARGASVIITRSLPPETGTSLDRHGSFAAAYRARPRWSRRAARTTPLAALGAAGSSCRRNRADRRVCAVLQPEALH